jgi:predicted  nucleic acid-binding Zn-ribbon protein
MRDSLSESARAAGYKAIADSIIDSLEHVSRSLANAVTAVQEDQATAREEMYALKQRLDSLERVLESRTGHLA